MTLTVAFAFNDAVLLCADQRRSSALSHTFEANVSKIHTFGPRAALMIGGLAPITGTVLARLRETIAGDVDLDTLAQGARNHGKIIYDEMIQTMAPHPFDYRRAEFTVAGFDAHGQPGIRQIGLHDGAYVAYGVGRMAAAGAPEVGASAVADANAVLGNPGPVFADELAHYVISRAALRLPSQVGLPADAVLLTSSGTFKRTMPEAELSEVQPMFQLTSVGSGFAHTPLVSTASRAASPRAGSLRNRPLSYEFETNGLRAASLPKQ